MVLSPFYEILVIYPILSPSSILINSKTPSQVVFIIRVVFIIHQLYFIKSINFPYITQLKYCQKVDFEAESISKVQTLIIKTSLFDFTIN